MHKIVFLASLVQELCSTKAEHSSLGAAASEPVLWVLLPNKQKIPHPAVEVGRTHQQPCLRDTCVALEQHILQSAGRMQCNIR